jgi:Protein of unknown function (DUF3179)
MKLKYARRVAIAAAVAGFLGCGVMLARGAAQHGMPYTSVDHPEFVAAADATFMSDSDLLIGIASGDMAKAYPAALLAQHGVVADQMSDGPIAITW